MVVIAQLYTIIATRIFACVAGSLSDNWRPEKVVKRSFFFSKHEAHIILRPSLTLSFFFTSLNLQLGLQRIYFHEYKEE